MKEAGFQWMGIAGARAAADLGAGGRVCPRLYEGPHHFSPAGARGVVQRGLAVLLASLAVQCLAYTSRLRAARSLQRAARRAARGGA